MAMKVLQHAGASVNAQGPAAIVLDGSKRWIGPRKRGRQEWMRETSRASKQRNPEEACEVS